MRRAAAREECRARRRAPRSAATPRARVAADCAPATRLATAPRACLRPPRLPPHPQKERLPEPLLDENPDRYCMFPIKCAWGATRGAACCSCACATRGCHCVGVPPALPQLAYTTPSSCLQVPADLGVLQEGRGLLLDGCARGALPACVRCTCLPHRYCRARCLPLLAAPPRTATVKLLLRCTLQLQP